MVKETQFPLLERRENLADQIYLAAIEAARHGAELDEQFSIVVSTTRGWKILADEIICFTRDGRHYGTAFPDENITEPGERINRYKFTFEPGPGFKYSLISGIVPAGRIEDGMASDKQVRDLQLSQ